MGTEAALAVIVFVTICLIFYGPWQDVCTGYARQIMFERRDALFDLASNGELDFKSSEYRTIRGSLEKTIRFAHEMSLPRFFLFRWKLRRMNLQGSDNDLFSVIDKIESPETRDKVFEIVARSMLAMFFMAMAKSPLTVLISIVGIFMIRFRIGFSRWLENATRPISEMVQMEAEYAPSSDLGSYGSRRAS